MEQESYALEPIMQSFRVIFSAWLVNVGFFRYLAGDIKSQRDFEIVAEEVDFLSNIELEADVRSLQASYWMITR